MSAPGPWSHPPPPPKPRQGRATNRLAWGALMLFAVGLLVVLWRMFPQSATTPGTWGEAARILMIIAVFAAALASRRLRAGQALRYLLIWGAIIGVLATGYAYRGELARGAQRVRADFSPGGEPVGVGPHEMEVSQAEDGGYYLTGRVNGVKVRFLVDTGSSEIVLSPRDARRVGVRTGALRYTLPSQTANGVGHGAAFTADALTVGSIRLTRQPMEINQAPLSVSLLGMAFFRQLESFRIQDGRLYLTWKDPPPSGA